MSTTDEGMNTCGLHMQQNMIQPYRMEILILATTLMSLEDILLNETSHKMTNTVQFSPCVIPGGVKFTNRKVE